MSKDFFGKLTNVCHDLLLDNKDLMGYLKEDRKMTQKTIESCKLGAFPNDLRDLYRKYDMNPVKLKEENIIWNANNSQFQLYPICIPIRNVSGKPIAIGCRTLLKDNERKEMGLPKYRNSVYKKSYNLFGIDKAIKYIRKENSVFVVEGYFDAIMAHQKNIKNVVATCGTSFSERQLLILSRYTNNIVLLFDNDGPGKISAKKAMTRFENTDNINLTYNFTPDGFKDLDEYLRNNGDINLLKRKENKSVK